MSAAALTPRVRIMVLCDEVLPSETEAGVFTLEGVRQQFQADFFPWPAQVSLFLLLFSPRRGTYQGKALVVDDEEERVIRYVKFSASFPDDHQFLPLVVDLGSCQFPEPGQYLFQIWFEQSAGGDVQKGELPFYILAKEE